MNVIRILILGASGMLGHKLFSELSRYKDLDVYATVRTWSTLVQYLPAELLNKIYPDVDANHFNTIVRAIDHCRPDLVINCIGIVKQSPASNDYVTSININALLPHRIALVCQNSNIRMLHISTDCVFDGNIGNYSENDIPNCTDLYGRTKLLGEVLYPNCLTLRTSIIGHELKSKNGLIEWFLAQENPIQGYTRHIFSGFPTISLARIIARYVIPQPELTGLYNLASEPISKHDLLRMAAIKYGKKIEIEPNDSVHCDRSLDCSKWRHITGHSPSGWPELVNDMYEDYLGSSYGVYEWRL